MSTPPPLTTTFTPPSSCFSSFYYQTYDHMGPSPVATECFPFGWSPETTFYFSPGICPSGYTTATYTLNIVSTLTETVATCCPSSYPMTTYAPGSTGCVTQYGGNSGSSVAYLKVYSDETFQGSTITRTMSASAGAALATLVEVRFQATDSSVLTPVLATTVTATVTATVGANGLSTGAKAGIGVGVPVFVLLLCAVIVGILLLRRRRGWRDGHGAVEGYPKVARDPTLYIKPELDSNAVARAELDSHRGGHKEEIAPAR